MGKEVTKKPQDRKETTTKERRKTSPMEMDEIIRELYNRLPEIAESEDKKPID